MKTNHYAVIFAFLSTIISSPINDYKTSWIGIAKAGVISGQVMSVIDDSPLVGAIVKVVKNGKMKASAMTDSMGYFSIPGLPAADYHVVAENKRYGTLTIESVPVRVGNEVSTHFILTPTYAFQ